jgi:hypothetical protein
LARDRKNHEEDEEKKKEFDYEDENEDEDEKLRMSRTLSHWLSTVNDSLSPLLNGSD